MQSFAHKYMYYSKIQLTAFTLSLFILLCATIKARCKNLILSAPAEGSHAVSFVN